jgi:hypothetical protein
MNNPKKTESLTLALIKGHEKYYKYQKPPELIKYEMFFEKTCRKTRDEKGNQVPLVDKQGNPVFYQLEQLLQSDVDNLSDDQRQIVLQDPRYRDPATGKIKQFPYKTLLGVVRVLTEADGKQWLKTRWTWEGLQRDKEIWNGSFDVGLYDHPQAVRRLKPVNPNDKDSFQQSVITAVNYQEVYDIPFTKENYEAELKKRDAPKDERHIGMTLQKINSAGIHHMHTYEVLDKEQFLHRDFGELWDYLQSAPLRDKANTKMGKEEFESRNKQYS